MAGGTLYTVLLIALALAVFKQWLEHHIETTSCRYCGKTSKRHESHCPMRIVEDD
jgi:hypothetical protein